MTHGWVWTSQGVWHAGSQSLIDLKTGGQLTTLEMGALELQRAEPRLASWAALRWAGGLGEQVELIARPSRALACIGFAVLGLRASAWSRPWVTVVGVGAVLLVAELLGWTLAAQGQIPGPAGRNGLALGLGSGRVASTVDAEQSASIVVRLLRVWDEESTPVRHEVGPFLQRGRGERRLGLRGGWASPVACYDTALPSVHWNPSRPGMRIHPSPA